MLFMFKQTVLAMSDLQHLVLQCSQCRTEVVLDLTYTVPAGFPPRRSIPILQCPVCDNHFDSKVQENIEKFRQAYQALNTGTGSKISIYLKPEEETVQKTAFA